MSTQTPVVLILFNRPDVTRRVFDAIRNAQPNSLWVIGDGARPGHATDEQRVEETRAIINQVDWECDVRLCYSEENMGCRDRVASGLKWVFEQTERAIFLEDDCVPHRSFFRYCDELLDHYRDDPRVGAISGDNFQDGISRTPHSYYFSKYFHCWGWASWRRVWETFDVEMASWPRFRDQGGLEGFADTECERWYWNRVFDRQYRRETSSWAFSWLYNCWSQNALTILPDVNLVSNVGFADDATHCKSADELFANLPVQDIGPLSHPDRLFRNTVADEFTFGRNFYQDSLTRRAKRFARKNAGRIFGRAA